MAGGGPLDSCRRGCVRPHPRDLERHPDRFVVELIPLLVQTAMGTEQVAMVRGEDEDGIVVVIGHGAADPIDGPVDVVMEPVVKLDIHRGFS